MAKISKVGIKKAFKGSGGILSTVAKRIGVTRKAVYDYLNKHPEFKAIKLQEEEAIIDMAESSLFTQVKEKQPWATKYLLATKGKKRGYVERTEQMVDNTFSGEVNINIDLGKKKKKQ